jgi:hypothetical protein
MGDWEDVFGSAGMAEDFAPWDSPSWNNDWEHEYLNDNSYQTVSEWNEVGRVVNKGEKGKRLPSAGKRVFHKSQTSESKFQGNSDNPEHYFDNYEEAMNWAKENVGRVITRSADGK